MNNQDEFMAFMDGVADRTRPDFTDTMVDEFFKEEAITPHNYGVSKLSSLSDRETKLALQAFYWWSAHVVTELQRARGKIYALEAAIDGRENDFGLTKPATTPGFADAISGDSDVLSHIVYSGIPYTDKP